MDSQYKSILKATTIFGGTQLVQILVGFIRSKFVAVLIGTTGMGLNTVYMSSLTIFVTIFGLGVNMSIVKDLSKAYEQQNQELFAKLIITFRHLLLLLGALGTICVILFSPLLSQWAFNNKEQTLNFASLSLMLFFTLCSQGNTALLISSRRIKDTAQSSLLSSIISLSVAIPFFYFLRLDGIAPGIVFSSIGNYMVTYFYARKIKIVHIQLTLVEQLKLSKSFVLLGMSLVMASLFGNLTNYLINISITNMGGLSDLGLYGAGFTISIQTLTMVFASMGSDYYPRLAATADDKEMMNQTMNEQSVMVMLLAIPILMVFMLVSPLVIRILLSEEFLPVTGFIRVLCFGMIFRSASYALGYASLAKGDKKVYFYVDGVYSNVVNLLLSVIFYYFWGLIGLAWSFVVNYTMYFVVILLVVKKRYEYYQSPELKRVILFSALCATVLLTLSYLTPIFYYPIAGILTTILCFCYFNEINKKTGIFQLLFRRRNG